MKFALLFVCFVISLCEYIICVEWNLQVQNTHFEYDESSFVRDFRDLFVIGNNIIGDQIISPGNCLVYSKIYPSQTRIHFLNNYGDKVYTIDPKWSSSIILLQIGHPISYQEFMSPEIDYTTFYLPWNSFNFATSTRNGVDSCELTLDSHMILAKGLAKRMDFISKMVTFINLNVYKVNDFIPSLSINYYLKDNPNISNMMDMYLDHNHINNHTPILFLCVHNECSAHPVSLNYICVLYVHDPANYFSIDQEDSNDFQEFCKILFDNFYLCLFPKENDPFKLYTNAPVGESLHILSPSLGFTRVNRFNKYKKRVLGLMTINPQPTEGSWVMSLKEYLMYGAIVFCITVILCLFMRAGRRALTIGWRNALFRCREKDDYKNHL